MAQDCDPVEQVGRVDTGLHHHYSTLTYQMSGLMLLRTHTWFPIYIWMKKAVCPNTMALLPQKTIYLIIDSLLIMDSKGNRGQIWGLCLSSGCLWGPFWWDWLKCYYNWFPFNSSAGSVLWSLLLDSDIVQDLSPGRLFAYRVQTLQDCFPEATTCPSTISGSFPSE